MALVLPRVLFASLWPTQTKLTEQSCYSTTIRFGSGSTPRTRTRTSAELRIVQTLLVIWFILPDQRPSSVIILTSTPRSRHSFTTFVALVGVLGFLLVENTGSPSRSWPCSALAGFTSVSQHWSYGKEIRGVSMISLIFLAFPFTWLGSFCLTFDFVGSFPFLLCYCLKSKSSFSSLKSIIICVCFTKIYLLIWTFSSFFFYDFSCCTYSFFRVASPIVIF